MFQERPAQRRIDSQKRAQRVQRPLEGFQASPTVLRKGVGTLSSAFRARAQVHDHFECPAGWLGVLGCQLERLSGSNSVLQASCIDSESLSKGPGGFQERRRVSLEASANVLERPGRFQKA